MSHQVVTMPMISNTLLRNDYNTESETIQNTCDDVPHYEAKALHSVQLYTIL